MNSRPVPIFWSRVRTSVRIKLVKIGDFVVDPDSLVASNTSLNFPIPFGAEGDALRVVVYEDDTVGRSTEMYNVILGSKVREIHSPAGIYFHRDS